jgi:hypothetical protein
MNEIFDLSLVKNISLGKRFEFFDHTGSVTYFAVHRTVCRRRQHRRYPEIYLASVPSVYSSGRTRNGASKMEPGQIRFVFDNETIVRSTPYKFLKDAMDNYEPFADAGYRQRYGVKFCWVCDASGQRVFGQPPANWSPEK